MITKFERYSQPVIPFRQWLARVGRSIGIAASFMGVALSLGVFGYHLIGGLSWIDSLLEASMILGGEGPIAPMNNDGVKLFASAYALFSGLVAVSGMAIILGPWLHRLLHHLHAEPKGEDKGDKDDN